MFRVEQPAIEYRIRTYLRILFERSGLAVNQKDHFRRYPTAAQLLILVELCLLCLRAVFSRRLKHPYEIEIFLVDPELRRMQIALLRADDVNRAALPRVLAQN